MTELRSNRTTSQRLREVTAVVPVRNGAALLPRCLAALLEAGPAEIIVVDGLSTDGSRETAAEYGVRVLSDDGRGLPYARTVGAEAAQTPWVVLVDCDVVFPPGALAQLVDEFVAGDYTALQAGQLSVGGPGYWGRALAAHHRTGRSRHWFGLVATVFDRAALLTVGFDEDFVSGEDIELRWRLRVLGHRVGVSNSVTVEHRFAGDDFGFAKDQFLMDGNGLGMMIRRRGARGMVLLGLPAAAALRGIALSLAHGRPQWVLYYLAYAAYNYTGIARGLAR